MTLVLHGIAAGFLRELIPIYTHNEHAEGRGTEVYGVPQLHTEVILDVVVIPVVLPQLVSGRLRCAWCGALQISQMRLRVVPVCAAQEPASAQQSGIEAGHEARTHL